jgi:hypothetical protein
MPSTDVGAEVLRNHALNCWPWVRSLILASGGDPLAGGDRCRVSHHRDKVALPARLGAQDAEAVLVIMIGDALDETGKNLLRRFLRRGLHGHLGNKTRSMKALCRCRRRSGNIGRKIWPRVATLFQSNSGGAVRGIAERCMYYVSHKPQHGTRESRRQAHGNRLLRRGRRSKTRLAPSPPAISLSRGSIGQCTVQHRRGDRVISRAARRYSLPRRQLGPGGNPHMSRCFLGSHTFGFCGRSLCQGRGSK